MLADGLGRVVWASCGLNAETLQHALSPFNRVFDMTCCAEEFRASPARRDAAQGRPWSGVAAYLAFLGAVVFTLLAVSALVTSDLPLPWVGLWS